MMRKCSFMKGFLLFALVHWFAGAAGLRGAAAQARRRQKPTYTIPEYNAFQAARAETNPQNRVKLLDDFVSKFPNSTLMIYVDQLYLTPTTI